MQEPGHLRWYSSHDWSSVQVYLLLAKWLTASQVHQDLLNYEVGNWLEAISISNVTNTWLFTQITNFLALSRKMCNHNPNLKQHQDLGFSLSVSNCHVSCTVCFFSVIISWTQNVCNCGCCCSLHVISCHWWLCCWFLCNFSFSTCWGGGECSVSESGELVDGVIQDASTLLPGVVHCMVLAHTLENPANSCTELAEQDVPSGNYWILNSTQSPCSPSVLWNWWCVSS